MGVHMALVKTRTQLEFKGWLVSKSQYKKKQRTKLWRRERKKRRMRRTKAPTSLQAFMEPSTVTLMPLSSVE